METSLEDKLLQDIIKSDNNAILQHISRGANPNKITSHGKTCLGEASKLGNTVVVQILLDSYNENVASKQGIIFKKCNRSHKRKLKSVGPHDGSVSKFKNTSEELYQCHKQNINGKEIKNNEKINQDILVSLNSDGSSSDSSSESKAGNTKPQAASVATSLHVDLEWDEDIGTAAPITHEDETWSSIYRWYAAILEKTGAALASASKVTNGINQQDAYMRTALHYATEQGHTEIVKLLLDSGSKLDVTAGDGLTALHIAVIRNNIQIVNMLLSAGSHINYKTHEKMTALHFAASRGFLELVKILVSNGANLEARDTNERTALYLATGRGHIYVIKYLISSGANVNGEEIHGYTPLCEAVWQKYTQVVEVLLTSGARVTHSHKLLHNAVMQGQKDIVRMLINRGGGINLCDDAGDTALLLAVRLSHIEIIKELLQKKANINLCNNITGSNALHIAVESFKDLNQFEQLLLLLLEEKIDMNATALTGDTALNRALLLQKDNAAILLIRHGADVNTIDFQSCGLDNLSMVKRRATNHLARLLLKAGHYRPELEQCCIQNKDTTAYWLHQICKEPFSLLDICRIQIRLLCRQKPLHQCIPSLPIPISLQRFLMFEDEI
ncbi:ankyrin-3-like [Pieris brassicae]|uniref:ankyrin-3-like n=1 Tax=Pieris brassicae TaxID=7116 RepID=UPI001E662883|nr:ankyrin-3-like [Pieris brassicae]